MALRPKGYAAAAAAACILVNALLTLAFLVLIIVLNNGMALLTMPKESSVCIPCDEMKSFSNTNLCQEATCHSVMKMRDDGMCCGPVESIAQMFFQKMLAAQHHYSSSYLSDIAEKYAECDRETNDKQPIAKVAGIVEFKPSFIDEGHYKVLWNESGRTFYANNCIHLSAEGEIFVRQSGYYIVSSQLNLRRPKDTSTSVNRTRPMTFVHNVNIIPDLDGTTGALMQTKNTIGKNVEYLTSFMSAVFMLNEYDRLFVSVSHPEMLDIGNPNDHFLVYYTYDLPN